MELNIPMIDKDLTVALVTWQQRFLASIVSFFACDCPWLVFQSLSAVHNTCT